MVRTLSPKTSQGRYVQRVPLSMATAVPLKTGRTLFARLMEHREEVRLYAFDLLWLNGQDLQAPPLLTRKQHLKVLLRRRSPWLIFVDHIREHGRKLFQLACRDDLKGLLPNAPTIPSSYKQESPLVKITNPTYSQREGRAATASLHVKLCGIIPAL